MTERARSHADVLFGSGTDAETPSLAPPPSAADHLFETTVGADGETRPFTTDARLVELLGADYPEPREMFPVEVALRPALAERLRDVQVTLQVPATDRIQRHRDFVEMVRDSGLDPNVAGQQLYHLLVDAQVAAARRGVAVANPDAESGDISPTTTPLVEDLLGRFLAHYGPERGERLVRATDAYIEAHPKLATVLQTPGLAALPGFKNLLDQIVEHVRVREHI